MSVICAKGAQQGIDFIWIAQIKSWMTGERRHASQGSRQTAAGLYGQPFIDHQRFVLPAFEESSKRGFSFCAGGIGQHRKRGKLVSHVIGAIELLVGKSTRFSRIQLVQITEAQIAQAATCRIGYNKSPVQITGGAWQSFQTLALTAVDQTFDVFTLNRIDTGSAHNTLITAGIQLLGNAIHSRRVVIRHTKSGVFAESVAIVATDANYTSDQANANYAATFSFAVTNPSAGTIKLRITARVTGALEAAGASYKLATNLQYSTDDDLVNIT